MKTENFVAGEGLRLLVVINGHSRAGAARTEAALTELRSAGFDCQVLSAGSRDEVGPWIARHAPGAAGVVAVGGDGTANAAAPGAVAAGLPFGLIPAGTANDLARTLGIPVEPKAAARVIAQGGLRAIDLGEVNGRLYFNVASLGLSVDLARRLDRETKRKFGRFGYWIACARVLFGARPFRAVIAADGEIMRVKSLQIAVGNGRFYGGGLAVEHSAQIDDGCLDLYSLEFAHPWKLLAIAKDFLVGRHGLWREVRVRRAQKVEIRTRRRRAINADGEIIARTPATFLIRREALKVFTPVDAEEAASHAGRSRRERQLDHANEWSGVR
ncbi:YegS/Rv2252/BmrU family lipid kinase [Rhodoblastus acidophilus]|uniref:lipid kinase n=1 Tax=Rhodoblastus acidophilus TaxID=1074 RepID=UPI002223F3BA|nr:lipid kinase [Rhodoblastus acidophilus]MCW2318728.1 YegS/Rv2252/BmrU family lipid kinase [Rhodoblastus acidophilus]